MMKKAISFILFFAGLAAPVIAQDAKLTDVSTNVFPILHYANEGGYFYIKNGELYILEAVYDTSTKDGRGELIGFIEKSVETEIIIKGRVINTDTTVYVSTHHGVFIRNNINDLKSRFTELPAGRGRAKLDYKDYDVTLYYQNGKRIRSHVDVTLRKEQGNIRFIYENADYIWSKIVGKYLVIAFHSQGGSGHTIYLNIYNLEDMLSMAE